MLRIAAGDEKAFAKFVAQHWKNIFGHGLAWLKSPEQAEEMAQDVFVKLWKKRHQLLNIKDVDGYLFIVARNTMISRIRAKLREPGFVADQEKEDQYYRPDLLMENKESYTILLEAMALLPARRQQVFKMSRLDGLSNKEIAARLDMNKDTVKQYLTKAVVFLRAYLNERQKTLLVAIWLINIIKKNFFPGLLPFLINWRL